MQQVGGSIGTSALSTIALTATASYLLAHHVGRLAPAVAATHGYTRAFAVSAALLGLGFILAVLLLPSKRKLAELRNEAAAREAASARPAPAAPAPAAPSAQPLQETSDAIPAALCSCSPVVNQEEETETTEVR
jgi:hypothetical protein